MDEFYYILYFDRAKVSLKYPHDIVLEALESFDSALLELNNSIDQHLDIHYSNNFKETDYYHGVIPILISNDLRLYKKYRCVFTESEFHAYCVNWPEKETQGRNKYLQYISDHSKLAGVDGDQTFAHFLNIKNGLYQEAHMYTKSEYWDEKETGNRYEIEVEYSWKTEKRDKIFSIIESKEIGKNQYRNTLINQNNPNRLYILNTDKFNETGKTDRLDLSQFEIQEKGIKDGKSLFQINFKRDDNTEYE